MYKVFLSSFYFVSTTVLLLISSISLDFILIGKGQFTRLILNDLHNPDMHIRTWEVLVK